MAAGHADLDGAEPAQVAIAGELAGEAEVAARALLRADLEHAAVAPLLRQFRERNRLYRQMAAGIHRPEEG